MHRSPVPLQSRLEAYTRNWVNYELMTRIHEQRREGENMEKTHLSQAYNSATYFFYFLQGETTICISFIAVSVSLGAYYVSLGSICLNIVLGITG